MSFFFIQVPPRTESSHGESSSMSTSTAETPATLSDRTICLQNCVIKGYHHYKLRPPVTDPPTKLTVDREYMNIHDKSACLVWIPELDTFDATLHNLMTDEKRHLYLRDVAGLPCGHVPREIAPCFREVLDEGGTVYAEVSGEPIPSAYPWPEQQDIGGGVVLPCNYFIKPTTSSFNKTLENIQTTVSGMEAGSTMTVTSI